MERLSEGGGGEEDTVGATLGGLFPASERPLSLFNGADLSGWQGETGRYFTVAGGSICARNNPADAPRAPSFLVTGPSHSHILLTWAEGTEGWRHPPGTTRSAAR